MSVLDENIDYKATIECARVAIENLYKEADQRNWQIQNDLRGLLNQDYQGAYLYVILNASDEIREQLNVDIEPLPKGYELLTKELTELQRLNNEKTQIICNLHTDRLILKNCVIRFMKHHPTWRLGDDERKLIFGENN